MEYSVNDLKVRTQDDMLSNASKFYKGGLFMRNNINETIEQIIALYENGANPRQFMQNMAQRTPQMNQMQTQLQNMAQGRTPKEFILQLARQNGVNEKNLQGLERILGSK
jgi:hypothetical protein